VYVPAWQSLHADDWLPELYVPAAHGPHDCLPCAL
jgi:hypothetical protein